MSPALEVHHVTRAFGRITAVNDVSLLVEPGEIVGLVGANGAGKTTLLDCCAGILRPDRGRIAICGFSQVPEVAEGRRLLAHVGDSPAIQWLTVLEHLRFAGELYRVADWRARADVLLDRFGLTDRAAARASTLSLGLQQRLVLARAFLHDPKLVLLDEAMNGLDPVSRKRLADVLRDASARGAAIVLATHQVEVVAKLATRIVVLEEGRVRWDGSVADKDENAIEEIVLRETTQG